MKINLAGTIMKILDKVSLSTLYNQTFTGIGQNPNTSFGGSGRKKWPRNISMHKKKVRMKQARNNRRKV